MRLRHARTELELHELSRRDGPTLLLLHALGGSSADWAEAPALWPGRVCALDFCGHGRSQWLSGGAYYPELLTADADAALAELGPCALAGSGLGAYVGLLLAASRADRTPGVLLLPGRGLDGGGPEPDFDRSLLAHFTAATPPLPAGCDPLCCTLERDARPPAYVAHYAAKVRHLLLLADGGERPPWWHAAAATPSAEVIDGDLRMAFARLVDNHR